MFLRYLHNVNFGFVREYHIILRFVTITRPISPMLPLVSSMLSIISNTFSPLRSFLWLQFIGKFCRRVIIVFQALLTHLECQILCPGPPKVEEISSQTFFEAKYRKWIKFQIKIFLFTFFVWLVMFPWQPKFQYQGAVSPAFVWQLQLLILM